MRNISLLLIDDDKEQEELLQSEISELNNTYKDDDISFILDVALNPEEAIIKLYRNNYSIVIIDLNLSNDDMTKDDDDISGNIILNQIMDREVMPIIVRSATPHKLSIINNHNDFITICSKDESFYKVIKTFLDKYDHFLFEIYGTKGDINTNFKNLIWNIIPNFFLKNKSDITHLDNSKKRKVIIRYISNWLTNKYMYDDGYEDFEPIEMYLFPNPIDQICTCDIFMDSSNSYYLVMNPTCDLVNKKVEDIIMCEIKSYDNVQNFSELLKSYNRENKDKEKKEKLEKLFLWFTNSSSASLRYHFLPPVNNFKGGFVDFRSMIFLKYNKNTGTLEDNTYEKIGVITDHFKKDIVSRFSSYYHRQGQPKFNSDIILDKLTN